MATVTSRLQHGAEIERCIDSLTAEAQRQIGLQYETADANDVKTIGTVAGAVAAVALISATQTEWSPKWLVPLLFLVAGVACFLKSLWQRPFERGPRVPDLYRSYTGTLVEAKSAILQELVRALEHNDAQLPSKARWYAAGCWCLVPTGWSAAIVIFVSV